MSSPGSGRYTTYVPVASPRNTLLSKLFNGRAAADQAAGVIYGKADQTNNKDAAAAAVATATGAKGIAPPGKQTGDLDMFPEGVDLSFGKTHKDDLDVSKVAWQKAGDPANAYVPDITSPGPGKTSPMDKNADPKISVADLKPNYQPGAPGTGTASPSTTSPALGDTPIGKPLTMGKSSV